MPCLIPEMLFAIGKKLVEDGDSDAVLQFTLSGKESLKAMKNVFASVTSLELYRDGYAIGWDNGCTKYKLQDDKPFCKFLMDQIGTRVEKLHLDIDGNNKLYQTVLDKIMAHPRVVTLTVGSQCSPHLLDKLLFAVSSSLKNVSVPSSMLQKTFRDSLNLDSLVVLDSNGYDYLSFCCKTKSLELNFGESNYVTVRAPTSGDPLSPYLSTVKKIIFNATTGSYCPTVAIYRIKNRFPALEVIHYNEGSTKHATFLPQRIFWVIKFFQDAIEKDVVRSPKFACKFYKCDKSLEFPSFDTCKEFLDGTGYYDETNQKFNVDLLKDFHCFRLNIPSNVEESRTTIVEIQIAK